MAKHGNRAVTSASGSADVLEALGFSLDLPAEQIERSIDELGFGFLFAPTHHPAMRFAAPVRRELAVRTVFNVLGPLTNPAGARAQVVGVYAPELASTIAEVLAQLGAERAFVVHGADGIDELSPTGPNLVCEVKNGEVSEREVDPLDLGIPRCPPSALAGGTPRGERGDDPGDLRRRDGAASRCRGSQRGRGHRRRRARPRSRARAAGSTRARPVSGWRSSLPSRRRRRAGRQRGRRAAAPFAEETPDGPLP